MCWVLPSSVCASPTRVLTPHLPQRLQPSTSLAQLMPGDRLRLGLGNPNPMPRTAGTGYVGGGSPDPMEEGRNKPRSLVELSSSC